MILLEDDWPRQFTTEHASFKVTCPAQKSTCYGLTDGIFSSPVDNIAGASKAQQALQGSKGNPQKAATTLA